MAKETLKARNPLKDPQPGDKFLLSPEYPDGTLGSPCRIEIQSRVEKEARGRYSYVYGIRRGSGYLSYKTYRKRGQIWESSYVTSHQEIGGMVSRLRREKAVVLK